MKTFVSSFPGCVYVTAPQRSWTLEISAAQHGPWTGTSTSGVIHSPQAGTTLPSVINVYCSHPVLSSSALGDYTETFNENQIAEILIASY